MARVVVSVVIVVSSSSELLLIYIPACSADGEFAFWAIVATNILF